MKVGATSMLVVGLKIDTSLVDEIIWSVKGASGAMITKNYPGAVTYDEANFYIPFSQEDTIKLGAGYVKAEGQMIFKNRVVGKTNQIPFYNENTIATKLVTGNKPDKDTIDKATAVIIGELVVGRDGKDGVSPVVSVDEVPGGHIVTITDAEGPQSFEVKDGQDGGYNAFEISTDGDLIWITDSDSPSAIYSIDEDGNLILEMEG